jgi:hypothetical protein
MERVRNANMANYDFTVVLKDSPELTEELADSLFAAGCDDGTPGMCCGSTVVDFHRQAQTLEAAIRSAVADVSSAGCIVARVEIDAERLAASSS